MVLDSFSLTLAIFAEKAFFNSLCVELLFFDKYVTNCAADFMGILLDLHSNPMR